MYSQEGLLDHENEKYVVFTSYLFRDQLLLPPAAQPGAHLSPTSVSVKLKWRTVRAQPMKTGVSVTITIIVVREGSYLKLSKTAASGLRPS